MQLRIAAHDAHFNQSAKSQSLPFKNNTRQNASNEKRSHLMFKLSFSCNHASSKSLSPLSNSLVDDALIQFIPFAHSAFSQLLDVLDFGLVQLFLKCAPDLVVHLEKL